MVKIRSWLSTPVSIAPLVVFRIGFGLLMAGSLIRFWSKGWIEQLYVQPDYHFKYLGFQWVHTPDAPGIYLLFLAGIVAALMIAFGAWYRMGAVLFAGIFAYIELIDKTTYLNHYYFISLVALLMIFLPAQRRFSVDAWRKPRLSSGKTARWCVAILIFQLTVVYFFSGLSKLNSDWLLQAQPLKTWLPAHTSLPLIGTLMGKTSTAYVFSWFGALYDLSIPYFLLCKPTRKPAYLAVIVFHALTAILFPIGMFPYIMIVCTLIFFPAPFHERIISALEKRFKTNQALSVKPQAGGLPRAGVALIIAYVLVQLALPLRHYLYPGELFWNGEGYRFSWRVMLIEKAGYAQFRVEEEAGSRSLLIDNNNFLIPLQKKMMSTQPDMILDYAHYLKGVFTKKGWKNPRVYANVHVALNGRGNREFVDPDINLADMRQKLTHKDWILPLPLKDHIDGF